MAATEAHPLTLFSLLPRGPRAEAVLAHSDNESYVSTRANGKLAFDIGLPIRAKSSTTLVTLGRGNEADIYVEGSSISKIQCSFELDLKTGVVMFYDRSHGCTSQVSGENATPFELGRARKVVVKRNFNTIIGMGGTGRDLVRFELDWRRDFNETVNTIQQYGMLPAARRQHIRIARTIDEESTELPSHRDTRIHTPHSHVLRVRYVKVGLLGRGTFGEVHKAIDVDSGKVMAVKILQRPQSPSRQDQWKQVVRQALKREIELLSNTDHPNIVDYIASQGWHESDIEIFMGLKDGTLESLIQNGADAIQVAQKVLPHMLRALDCIAHQGIVHRDVKPENILYIKNDSGHLQFQLGDFGLCNRALEAVTYSGSPMFMAPEIRTGGPQSCKADVWSLLVTILWTMNTDRFRQTEFQSSDQVQAAVLHASHDTNISQLAEMAIVDPHQRASAAQMLVKLYDGDGLSTPRKQIPPLGTDESTAVAPATAMIKVSPGFIAREATGGLKGLGRAASGGQAGVTVAMAGIRKRTKPSITPKPKAPVIQNVPGIFPRVA